MNSSECAGTAKTHARRTFSVGKKGDYGIFFLMELARKRTPRSVGALAKEGGVSFSFLQKVAHLLKRSGLVVAHRGKDGGFVLARPANQITMKDIVDALDGRTTLFSCNESPRLQRACPRRNFCRARERVAGVQKDALEQYFSKTLSDMIT